VKRMIRLLLAGLLLFLVAASAACTENEALKHLQSELEKAERVFYAGEVERAYTMFGQLAEQGCAKAQSRYGLMMEGMEGYEPDRDAAEVRSWVRRAAEQGYADAQHALGFAYDFGSWGLGPRDFDEALPWYRSAAQQGHPHAMTALYMVHYHGHGVDYDPVFAYKWLLLAVPRFPPPHDRPAYDMGANHESRERTIQWKERLADDMTREQIAEAESLAQAWEEDHDYIRHMPETSDEPLPLWFDAIEAGCND